MIGSFVAATSATCEGDALPGGCGRSTRVGDPTDTVRLCDTCAQGATT